MLVWNVSHWNPSELERFQKETDLKLEAHQPDQTDLYLLLSQELSQDSVSQNRLFLFQDQVFLVLWDLDQLQSFKVIQKQGISSFTKAKFWSIVLTPHQIIDYLTPRTVSWPFHVSCSPIKTEQMFPFVTPCWERQHLRRLEQYFKCEIHDIILSVLLGACTHYQERYTNDVLRNIPTSLHIDAKYWLQCLLPYSPHPATRLLGVMKHRVEVQKGYLASFLASVSPWTSLTCLKEEGIGYTYSQFSAEAVNKSQIWQFLPLSSPTSQMLSCHAVETQNLQLCCVINTRVWRNPQFLLDQICNEWKLLLSAVGIKNIIPSSSAK
jgi:hypothetical protein